MFTIYMCTHHTHTHTHKHTQADIQTKKTIYITQALRIHCKKKPCLSLRITVATEVKHTKADRVLSEPIKQRHLRLRGIRGRERWREGTG